MKTRATISKLLIISAFATTTVFGQTVYTWTGAANGTNLATAGNWNPTGQPNGTTQDTALFDNGTNINLLISYTATGLPGTGFGTSGVNFALTGNQTNSVTIFSPSGTSAAVGIFSVTNSSTNSSLTFGDSTANQMVIVGRPAGAVHDWVNNSAAPVTINSSVQWQAGGGTAYTLDFSGTGNWLITNSLLNDNGAGGTTIELDGPGSMYWSQGLLGNFNSPEALITLTGGTMFIESSGLLTSTTINNGSTLQYDAAGQSQLYGGIIFGAGQLVVSRGTLTLLGQNTYTGSTVLTNNGANSGTVVVDSAETPGTSGPLGNGSTIFFGGGTLQFSVNNTFDYTSRFTTNAGQLFNFNTGGQTVVFANGLTNSGSSLNLTGPGTLTLAGTNTYPGTTTVNSGTLVFQGPMSGTGNITVADSATLGVTATSTQVKPGALTLGTSAGANLQFNNVNSTTTAPLAPGTLAAAGTLTININSGTFTVGQTYPLLTWTTGSAPTVSLGILNGYIGTLSFSGNKLLLSITGTAYSWTGANNGNWDTTTANNWIQNGVAAVFANGGPALFDDTATGTSSVTLNGVVQPASVTVANSLKAYTLTSTSGKDIAGSGGFTKSGTNTLAMSGGANAYTGATTILQGTMSVGALANSGSPSDIGAATSSAANLVLNGGTLQYTGGAANIDHLFTLGTGGGTIDSSGPSGSSGLGLTNAGAAAYSGTGARVLTVTGSDTDTNILAAALADNGGATQLIKAGAGNWFLTGTNTYSGGTLIEGGTLQVGLGAGGAIGSGTVLDNTSLLFNLSSNTTVGAISGSGTVTQNGTGTVILAGNNSYAGATTINSGTLQVGNGGATGQLNSAGNIVDNGTLIFNSTGALTMNAGTTITGTGQLMVKGTGLLTLIGNESFTGGTTIAAGAQMQIAKGNTGTYAGNITNNGSLTFVRQDNAVFIYTGNISGTGSVTKEANNPQVGDITFEGTNTYTGGTIIRAGNIILGDNIDPGFGSIVGNVLFTNSLVNDGVRTLIFNRPDNYTFSGNITGSGSTAAGNMGSVTQEGSGVLTLTGVNTYTGATTISGGALQAGAGGITGSVGSGPITDNSALVSDRADNVSIGGAISGIGTVTQIGAGTLTLTASNTYTGATIVSNGTMVLNFAGDAGTNAVGGDMDVSGGTLIVSAVGSNTTLNVGGALNISSGTVVANLNKNLSQSNSMITALNGINGTNGTLKLLNFGPSLVVGDKFTIFASPVTGGTGMKIVSPGYTFQNNLAVDGSVKVTAITLPGKAQITATSSGGQLNVSWPSSDTGLRLQVQTNSVKVGISNNWVDILGTESNNTYSITIGTNGAVFYRLAPQ